VSSWSSTKAREVFTALIRIGWSVKRQRGGSHRILQRERWPDFVFAFHDNEELGPRLLARIARRTGLTPNYLWLAEPHNCRLERPPASRAAAEPAMRYAGVMRKPNLSHWKT
jgi:predicted RNA binding protein YcfA (HicA-like mRNA interferase family)